MKLSLILPTLNERDNLEVLIPELLLTVPQLAEILVLDDGSTDGTHEVVRDLSAAEPRVRLFVRSGPPSLTAALQEGILAAKSELVGWMDADLAMAPADLARLVAAVEAGADAAIGSRFVMGGGIKGQEAEGFRGRMKALKNVQNSEDSWVGVALSWALNAAILPALIGDGVHDYTSGFVVLRRDLAVSVRLQGDHGEYFIGLWTELERRGAKVVEVAYQIRARQHGKSKTASALSDYGRRGVRYLSAAARARLQSLTGRAPRASTR
ncbi:MAG: glycosyltransferase [Deltaproteobacteria bacterium]|nr:glycosyltransferase [Deltaproteobacteria bacterium]